MRKRILTWSWLDEKQKVLVTNRDYVGMVLFFGFMIFASAVLGFAFGKIAGVTYTIDHVIDVMDDSRAVAIANEREVRADVVDLEPRLCRLYVVLNEGVEGVTEQYSTSGDATTWWGVPVESDTVWVSTIRKMRGGQITLSDLRMTVDARNLPRDSREYWSAVRKMESRVIGDLIDFARVGDRYDLSVCS